MKFIAPVLVLVLLATTTGSAQSPGAISKSPVGISKFSNFARSRSSAVRSNLNAQARAAVQKFKVRSIPYWTAAFNYQGTSYPLYFVGQSVFSGSTAIVDTPVIAVKFRFLDYIDPTGQPYELDATPQMPDILASPNFVVGQYPTGVTQFQDAAQRASFYGYYRQQWHTLLGPRQTRTITLDVPAGTASLFYLIEDPSVIFALVDTAWAESQFSSIISALNIPVESFPIVISHNVFLAAGGDIANCCIFGLHGAYFSKVVGITYFLQTWAWADWPSPELAVFGIQDAFGLSHEIAEWMNDPFEINFVPRWQWVDYYNYSVSCTLPFETSLYEVADPVQNYSGYPTTVRGSTYSMTNQVLLSWFTREVPSTALHGAYSFPDETIATGPSLSCP